MTDTIYDTGIKGFLKWMKADNPGLYAKVAPVLAQKVPQAFSTYEATKARLGRLANYHLGRLGDTTQSSPGLVDISFDPGQLVTTDSATQAVSDASDVSDVANSGSSTPSITSLITGIVGGISSLYLAKNQVDIQKQVTAIQLQRAQSGLPPLPISTAQLGVPQVAIGLSTSTQSMLLWGGLGLGALVLLSMGKSGGKSARR